MDSELGKSKTIHFQVNNKANLPSLEALQGEIEKYFPKDFRINHRIEYSPGRRNLDILGEKPYNSYGNQSYFWCNVYQNEEKSVNSYSIEIFYNIAESVYGELGATWSNTKAAIFILLGISFFVAAFFTGGATLLLLALLVLYGKYDERKETNKLKNEEKYLFKCREKMLQSLKEWERELNQKPNDQKYSYGGSSINIDRVSALKEKLSSANTAKGYKIAEDGTIIRN